MTRTFKVDIKHQIKSVSNGLWNIGMVPVALAVLWFWKDIYPDTFLIIGLFLWTLIWFIPAIILHPWYYSINRNTTFQVISGKEEFVIEQGDDSTRLTSNDIKVVERIYNSDFRHVEWQQNWFPVPWRNYGLLRIQTKDNQEFFLTSLMIDIVNPPIEPTSDKFKIVPFPPKTLKQRKLDKAEYILSKRNRVENFKIRFSDMTENELKLKTVANGLVEEAEIAAQELLKEKNTTANRVDGPATCR